MSGLPAETLAAERRLEQLILRNHALRDLMEQLDPAGELLEVLRTELGGEFIRVPPAREITLSDVELLALAKACDGDAGQVARHLVVSRRQVLNRLARITRRRY